MDKQEIIKRMGSAYSEYVQAYDSNEDIDGARYPRDKYPDSVSYMVSKIWPFIESQAERIEELEALLTELYTEVSYEKAGEWVIDNKDLQKRVKKAQKG